MTSRTDGSKSSPLYELRCLDCPFQATVEGDAFEAFDVIDAHEEKHAGDAFEHFVEIKSEEAG